MIWWATPPSIPSDPFGITAEASLMYLPEVASSSIQNNQIVSTEGGNQQDEEMFEDIVGNTNPVFRELEDDHVIQASAMYLHPN